MTTVIMVEMKRIYNHFLFHHRFAHSTQSIPKLYPIVGLYKELPGIALPLPLPLDLPKVILSRKVTSVATHQQVVREQPIRTGDNLGTVPEAICGKIQKEQMKQKHTCVQKMYRDFILFNQQYSILIITMYNLK